MDVEVYLVVEEVVAQVVQFQVLILHYLQQLKGIQTFNIIHTDTRIQLGASKYGRGSLPGGGGGGGAGGSVSGVDSSLPTTIKGNTKIQYNSNRYKNTIRCFEVWTWKFTWWWRRWWRRWFSFRC